MVCDLVEEVVGSVRAHSAQLTLRSELHTDERLRRFSFEVRE
jgi:hypothetical protein